MQKKQSSIRDFDILNKLGQGAFGTVFKVRRKQDKREYAMKKVRLTAMKQKEIQAAVNEIRILASLNDEYIIGYKDAFFDDTSSTLCIVMEYASGGDILQRVKNHIKNKTKFSELEIWRALAQMTKGLKTLHDAKIMHRDLKCANVFINKEAIYKIGDLNVSKVLKKGMAYTQAGTPYYASPQVWKDQPYDIKSDIWSLGCVIYEMAALKPPFQAPDLQGLYKKVTNGSFDRIPSYYSNDLASLINIMLKVSPRIRPTTDTILASPLLKKYLPQMVNNNRLQTFSKVELLETIKFNTKNLKALKDKLPKSKYNKKLFKSISSEDSINSLELLEEEEFLQMQRPQNKKQRKPSVQINFRERIMSACSSRIPKICQSPKKKISIVQVLPSIKKIPYQQIVPEELKPKSSMFKMPPKPQGYYKNILMQSKQEAAYVNEFLKDSVLHLMTPQKIRQSERLRYKENMINVAKNIINSNLPRSTSAQKTKVSNMVDFQIFH